MDWARVKSILIIVFLIVNIFLVIKILDKSNRKELTSSEIQSVKQLLSQNSITMQAQLPSQIRYMPRIKVTNEAAHENVLADKLIGAGKWTKKMGANGAVYSSKDKELIIRGDGKSEYKIIEPARTLQTLTNEEMVKEFAYSILKQFISMDNYQLESISANQSNYEVNINNIYKGNEVFNNSINVNIPKAGSAQVVIKQGFVDFGGFTGKPKKVTIVDALVELIRNVNINDPTVIKKISLGYYADFNSNNEVLKYAEANPAWEIETNKGIYFFNGYNGNLLQREDR